MKSKTIIFLAVFTLFCGDIVFSQMQYYSVAHYSIEDGLSQSTINHFIQDEKGIIWLATQDGVNKYDGYEFTVYRHEPFNKNSISSNYIRVLCEDDNNQIWIGTQIGINIFNPKNGKIKHLYHNKKDSTSLSSNIIYRIHKDKSNTIWVLTPNALDKYDPKHKSFKHYYFYNDTNTYPSFYNNFSIINDKNNNLWIGTKDGLNFFNKNTEKFFRFHHQKENINSLCHNEIRDIFEDNKGNLWIGTQDGLSKLDVENNTFSTYYVNKNNNQKENIVRCVFQDSEGIIWVGTEMGVKIMDEKTKKIINVPNDDISSINVWISDIFEDKSGIIWLASWKGLYKINKKFKKFKHIKSSSDYQISDNYITSILVDKQNRLWLGTQSKGLNIIDLNTKKTITYQNNKDSKHYIPSNRIFTIHKNTDGKIWIGTRKGYFVYNEKNKNFISIYKEYNIADNGYLKNNRPTKVIKFNDEYWIGTYNGLFKIINGEITQIPVNTTDIRSISSSEIYDILYDGEKIWIGTLNGLNVYNPKNKIFKKYYYNINDSNSLSNNTVLSIHKDKRGQIWAGTESGLNLYIPKYDGFKQYTQKNGFINDYFYSVLGDKNGNIWLSSNRGISMFNPITKKITNYDTDDGIQSYEFNLGASYIDSNNNLYFGGINGVNIIDTDSIIINSNTPKVVITKIEKIDNKAYYKVYPNLNNEITFNYKENFTIYFSTPEYSNPLRNFYSYRIKELEEDWTAPKQQNFVGFSQLSPGTYTFEVIGSNNDFIWNTNPTSLKIIIEPPIWQSDIAYFLYIISIILTITLIFLYITKRIRKENQILQEKQKAALKIEAQRTELEYKNKNITDSIFYARRIIHAMLPSVNYFKSILKESFVYYEPKDIVSGDFYWITRKKEKIFVAAVDCTGHGVPGAFMSIIGLEMFRNIINKGIDQPSLILDYMNNEVAHTFKNDDSGYIVKDGMDLALCVINQKDKTLEYSGAFNPLYIIRNNTIMETKADRFSVGLGSKNEDQLFTNHKFNIEESDIVYLFSDGYADQFGGQHGKKFKFRRFRHLLLNIHQLSFNYQQEKLKDTIKIWKRDNEQVDDFLIIGFKPLA